MGGNSGINKRVDVLETEVYSPDFDQWTTVAPISMGQSEAGACMVNHFISTIILMLFLFYENLLSVHGR